MASTADYWAIKCFGMWLVVPVSLLREVVREQVLAGRDIKITGDNGNRSVLMPATKLFRRAKLGIRPAKQELMF